MNTAEEDNAQSEAFERRRAREAAAAQTTRQKAEEFVRKYMNGALHREALADIEALIHRERAEAVEGERAEFVRLCDAGLNSLTNVGARNAVRLLRDAIRTRPAAEQENTDG